MLIKHSLLVCILTGLLLAACGCTPSLVGSDSGVYSVGKLYVADSRDMTTVYEAALRTLEEMGMEITEKAIDVFSAKIVAKGADGKKITVTMEPKPDGLTDLRIKVGVLGNRARTLDIYERIQQNLGIGSK